MPSELLNDYIAGAIGGSAGLIFGHPFDTVKVQQQTQNHSGLISCLKKISSTSLRHGFFRGLAYPLWSYGFLNAVYFGVYGNTLRWLTKGHEEKDNKYYFYVFLAGMVAGAAQTIPACPIEIVKVTLQSQIKSAASTRDYYTGPWQCCKAIIREHGIKGCYRGFTGQCVRDIPSFGLYILPYEWIHDKISEQSWADERGITASLIGGGTSGVISWVSIMPIDIIKSRLQSDTAREYNGTLDCIVKTYKSGGIRSFFKGTLVVSLRAFPTNAITFLVYKETQKELNKFTSLCEAEVGT